MSKRTDKEFEDYNDYHDRVFGLKWGTAFALDELTQVIAANKNKENKYIEELPLMRRSEIDATLQYALLKTLRVSIQLNSKDRYDNLKDSIVGNFDGIADEEYLYIEKTWIRWETIRNIQIVKK